MLQRYKAVTVLALVLALFVPLMAVGDAEAGCLVEQDTCASCARSALWRAMRRFSLGGIRKANLQLWDCSIDLFHCVVLGQHHNYGCRV